MTEESRLRKEAREKGPGGIRSLSLWVLGLLLTVSLGVASLGAGGRYPEEFKAAIQAQDQNQWEKSAELLRQALEAQPEEDGGRVRLYGTRYSSYLPHYYLGLALYKQGKCEDARKQWETSLILGFVQKTGEYEVLLTNQADCKTREASAEASAGPHN